MRLRAISVLIFVAAAGLIVVPVAAQEELPDPLVETFEDEDVLTKPVGDWYTHASTGSVNSFVTNSTAKNGLQSWYVDLAADGAGSRLEMDIDVCSADSIRLYMKWSNFDDRASGFGFSDSAVSVVPGVTAGADGFSIRAAVTTGVLQLTAFSGTAETTNLGAAVVDTWYDFLFTEIDCAEGSVRVASNQLFSEGKTAVAAVDHPGGTWTGLEYLQVGDDFNTAQYTGILHVDDIQIQPGAETTPTVSSSASASFTDLVGYDVDPSGTTVIVRTDSGDYVRVLGATTLTESANVQTACSQADGVAVSKSAGGGTVAFKHCMSAGEDDNELWIRSSTLGTPNQGSCGFAPEEFNLQNVGDASAQLIQMVNIEGFDVDFSNCDTTGINEVSIVLAFTSARSGDQGKVGLLGKLMVNNPFPDDEDESLQVFDSSTSPQVDQICFWKDTSDGRRYVAAAAETTSSKTWRASIDATGASQTISVGLTPVGSGTSNSFNAARGISCAEDRVFVATATAVTMGNRLFGASWSATASTVNRGVAVDPSGDFVGWVDGADIFVAYANNGTVVAQMDTPTGTFRGMKFDRNAQNLWVFTSTTVARFTVAEYTAGDVGTGDQGGGSTSTSTIGDGAFADTQASFADALGTSTLLAGLFGLSILMVAMAVHGAKALPENRLIGGAGGALIGLILGVSLGFVGLEWIFILTVISVAGLLFYWHRGN